MINFKDTKKQWEVLLPDLRKIMTTYIKDAVLLKYTEAILNKVEPKLARNEIVSEEAQVLFEVLSSNYYYTNRVDIKEDEENFLKDFVTRLEVFIRVARKEENVKETPAVPEPVKRFPNLEESKDLFQKNPDSKERIV